MCLQDVATSEVVKGRGSESTAADRFAERMLGVLNSASLALMMSIGHRTGLFDTMAELPPSGSREIAVTAGLNERYVREWLAAMATGRIVEYDPKTRKFSLPASHAAFLTRAAAPSNFGVPMQFFAVLGGVEDEIVRCFREGGGVPYERFNRFHEVMAEESAQSVAAGLFEHVLPLAPGLEGRLEQGIDVLDVGCGRGRILSMLAERFPNSGFAGYDLCRDAIEFAQDAAVRSGLANLRFETRDVTHLNEPERYDLVTAFDAIHDQARPALVLKEIHKALRPGGTFLMQDIRGSSCVHQDMDNPIAPFAYAISCMHCMTVSLAQGGDGLGAMWGRAKALELLAAAGFENVKVNELPHDIQNFWYVTHKG